MSAVSLRVQTRLKLKGEVYKIKYMVANGTKTNRTATLPDSPGAGSVEVSLEDELTGVIHTTTLLALHTALDQGQAEILPDENARSTKPDASDRRISLDDYPERTQTIIRFRLAAVERFLQLLGTSANQAAGRLALVKEINAQAPVVNGRQLKLSVSTLYRLSDRYVRGGHAVSMLAPDAGDRKSDPRLATSVETIIQEVIDAKLKAKENLHVKNVHEEVLLRLAEKNRTYPSAERLPNPSRATVGRRTRLANPRQVYENQHGREAAQHEFRQEGAMKPIAYPLERVELDHSGAKLWIVDDKDGLPLGGASICGAIDVATRCLWGYSLSFGQDGHFDVMECLYHGIRMKGDVRGKYHTAHGWDIYGVPGLLVVDNGPGEICESFEDACLSLRIPVDYNRRHAPYMKPYIERYWRTEGAMFLWDVPGSKKIRAEDGQEEACITLSDLDAALVKFIVDYYHRSPHRGLGGAKPAERWAELTQKGFSPRMPGKADDLLVLLGQVEWRSLWAYGLEIDRLRYNTPTLLSLRKNIEKHGNPDTELARRKHKVKVKIHPGDLASVSVYDPFEKGYLRVPVADNFQDYAHSLSRYKHRFLLARLPDTRDDALVIELAKVRREIQDIWGNAAQRSRRLRKELARMEQTSHPASLLDRAEERAEAPTPPLPVAAGQVSGGSVDPRILAGLEQEDWVFHDALTGTKA